MGYTGINGQLRARAMELLQQRVDPAHVVLVTRHLKNLREFAGICGRIARRQVRAVALSDVDSSAHATASGVPLLVAELLASFGQAICQEHLDRFTDAVEALSGRAPLDLESSLTRTLTGV